MTKTLNGHTAALLDAADLALEVLDNYSDVVDSDYGRPHPNRAMIAVLELRNALARFRKDELGEPGEPGEIF